MNSFKEVIQRGARFSARVMLDMAGRLENTSKLSLIGCRDIEWSWALAHLPQQNSKILDFGPGTIHLISLTAAQAGHDAVSFDVRQANPDFRTDKVTYIHGDILTYRFDIDFDCVLNISSIEHVGLGRYGDQPDEAGDLKAMGVLRGLLRSRGQMVLTIPMGQDAVHRPFHRVYGERRLPQLLQGFREIKSEYWDKNTDGKWAVVTQEQALARETSSNYYALGLFILEKV